MGETYLELVQDFFVSSNQRLSKVKVVIQGFQTGKREIRCRRRHSKARDPSYEKAGGQKYQSTLESSKGKKKKNCIISTIINEQY